MNLRDLFGEDGNISLVGAKKFVLYILVLSDSHDIDVLWTAGSNGDKLAAHGKTCPPVFVTFVRRDNDGTHTPLPHCQSNRLQGVRFPNTGISNQYSVPRSINRAVEKVHKDRTVVADVDSQQYPVGIVLLIAGKGICGTEVAVENISSGFFQELAIWGAKRQ